MSARPRPVTATFKPRSMDPPTGVRERRWSLSSGTSTASLVSVLDHDSYESPGTDTEDERERMTNENKNNNQETSEKSEYDTRISTTDPSGSKTDEKAAMPLTPWERWLIEKVKHDRENQKAEIKKKAKEKESRLQKKKETEEKKVKIDQNVKEWVEKKNICEKVQKKMELRRSKTQKEIEEEKKKETEEKAVKKFEEWKTMKLEEEKERKKQEAERKKKEEEEKLEKRQKCDAAYDEWCKKTANKVRPKSAHNSFGYTSGKLTGFYDGGAVPVPSYYNPIPWVPVHVPKPKSERKKRPKTAYKWNPHKYFN